jgi:hypothetical protein
MEAGTMSKIAFLEHPERHQQPAAVEPPVFGGKYLSIISFKRHRSGVATPVWFVQEDGRRCCVRGGRLRPARLSA